MKWRVVHMDDDGVTRAGRHPLPSPNMGQPSNCVLELVSVKGGKSVVLYLDQGSAVAFLRELFIAWELKGDVSL